MIYIFTYFYHKYTFIFTDKRKKIKDLISLDSRN